MVANGQVLHTSPADRLRERLDDPAVAEALNSLLDHADLLAILVAGLDGFVRRGDEISETLSSAVGELRGPALLAGVPGLNAARAELGDVDVQAVAAGVARLSGALVDALPTLNKLLQSRLFDPSTADVLADLGEAVVEGKAAAEADPGGPRGLFGLWRVTKDTDVTKGLGFLVQVARAFGRRLPN